MNQTLVFFNNVTPESGVVIHMKKPYFIVTGILCPYALVKRPVIP